MKANSQPAVCGAAATIAKIAPGATCTPFEVSTFLRFQERAEAAVFQRLLYASLVILEILVTRIGKAALQEAVAIPRSSLNKSQNLSTCICTLKFQIAEIRIDQNTSTELYIKIND